MQVTDIYSELVKLKRCPFCGAEAIIRLTDCNAYCVECLGCLASSRIMYARKEDPLPILVEAWNMRDGEKQPPTRRHTTMSNRFDYVKYDESAVVKQQLAKSWMLNVEEFIESKLPPSRAKSLALTKLEEVYMWVGKAIRDEQIDQRSAELQEEMDDE